MTTDTKPAAAPAAAAVAKAAVYAPKFITADLRPADALRSAYAMTVPATFSLDDVKQPSALWMQGYAKLKPGQLVEIHWENRSAFLLLYVIELDPQTQSIFTSVIVERDFSKDPERYADLTGAAVIWRGDKAKWCVMLGPNCVKSGFDLEGDGEAWIARKHTAKPAKAKA
jgi:hypothetical protein